MPNLRNRLTKVEANSASARRANDDDWLRVAGLPIEESRRRLLTRFLKLLERPEAKGIPFALRTQACDAIARLLPLIESPELVAQCRAAIARCHDEGTEP